MTGEITLTGQVLPIGGLKEKALAAQRGGIHTVIAPELNEQDVDEIPEHLRKDLEFRFVATIEEALEIALQRRAARRRPKALARRITEALAGSPASSFPTCGEKRPAGGPIRVS